MLNSSQSAYEHGQAYFALTSPGNVHSAAGPVISVTLAIMKPEQAYGLPRKEHYTTSYLPTFNTVDMISKIGDFQNRKPSAHPRRS
jgi:hypothetical protein